MLSGCHARDDGRGSAVNFEITGTMIIVSGFIFCTLAWGFGIICGIFWISRDNEFQRVPEGHVLVDKNMLDNMLLERNTKGSRKFDRAIPEAGANVAYEEN